MSEDSGPGPLPSRSPSPILEKLNRLPEGERARAFRLLQSLATRQAAIGNNRGRDPEDRRKYVGRPWAYIRDVFGYHLSTQQEGALDLVEKEDRVLIASANNQGKTFLLAAYSVYRFDCVASMPDPEGYLDEQGAKILLPGPDHDTVFGTIYSEILVHASRAEKRGYPMPGERSQKSVLWSVRAQWDMEAFSPRRETDQDIAHSASGRHHVNQVALIEEGQGVAEAVWAAVEGMCSGVGNKVVSAFNPSNPSGPVYNRIGTYKVMHLSAFDHPNVVQRKPIIAAAVDYKVIDSRVRRDCKDRGEYPEAKPERSYNDFVYGLAGRDEEERGPRSDKWPGMADAPLHVFRPNPGSNFEPQVLGRFPAVSDFGLYRTDKIEEANERWMKGKDPERRPDRVGLDFARTGGDEIIGIPWWGKTVRELLEMYEVAFKKGPDAILELQHMHRARMGRAISFPKGDGIQVGGHVHTRFPHQETELIGDEGGVGSSPVDVLNKVYHRRVTPVNFGGSSPDPIGGESYTDNMRTCMHQRLSLIYDYGLVDAPPDETMRQEMVAMEIDHTVRTAKIRPGNRTKKVPSIKLIPKDDLKAKLRRSPDRADAAALAGTDMSHRVPRVMIIKGNPFNRYKA